MSTNGNGIVRNYAPVDPAQPSSQPKKVAYFYDSDVGNYAYNAGHPMKPHRIRMAHSLIMNYNLYKHLEIYRAKPASKYEMICPTQPRVLPRKSFTVEYRQVRAKKKLQGDPSPRDFG